MTDLNRIAAALRATPAAAWRETAEDTMPEVELEDEAYAEDKPDSDEDAPAEPERIRSPQKRYATSPLRQKTDALVKMVGERMKAARELCNMSQLEAARRLGYSNSSKLNKVENATDTRSVPFWLIREAALVYDVSTEYLHGLSDDFETGCYRGVTPFLMQQWDAQRARDLKALAVLNARIVTALKVLPALQAAADYAMASIEVFEQRNKDFEDLPGGARLQAAARGLQEAVAEAAKAQRHLHLQLPPELTKEPEHA